MGSKPTYSIRLARRSERHRQQPPYHVTLPGSEQKPTCCTGHVQESTGKWGGHAGHLHLLSDGGLLWRHSRLLVSACVSFTRGTLAPQQVPHLLHELCPLQLSLQEQGA